MPQHEYRVFQKFSEKRVEHLPNFNTVVQKTLITSKSREGRGNLNSSFRQGGLPHKKMGVHAPWWTRCVSNEMFYYANENRFSVDRSGGEG